MYLWRKVAAPPWLNAHEARLQAHSLSQLATIAKPGAKRLQMEIACGSRTQAQHLLRDFGGWIEKVPRNWLKRLERDGRSKPLKIGSDSSLQGVSVSKPPGRFGNRPSLLSRPVRRSEQANMQLRLCLSACLNS
jgi:hypothetical protein